MSLITQALVPNFFLVISDIYLVTKLWEPFGGNAMFQRLELPTSILFVAYSVRHLTSLSIGNTIANSMSPSTPEENFGESFSV